MAVFSPNLGGILNDDVILGQIFGRDGGSEEITKIFECYKTRLVAKGFTQEYRIDYEENFAPVARILSVRALLAVATANKWNLFQMDVKKCIP